MRFFKDDEDDSFESYDGGMMSHHFRQTLKEDWTPCLPELVIDPCACGYDPNDNLLDCVRKVNRHSETTRIVCPEHNCGCGAWVQSETKLEAIEKWNRGEYEKPEDY